MGAVKEAEPHLKQFVSSLFLVEKGKDTGEFRPVINFKTLNRFLVKEKFKMEGLYTARTLIRTNDFMVKLDLKDAYYAIPMHVDSRQYLRFILEGRVMEFQCLPFGLSTAPRVFTKILHPIIAHLRSRGLRSVTYLDDLLIIHQKQEIFLHIFHRVLQLLTSLGLIVKQAKCSQAPTQNLVFLGTVIDSVHMTISLPAEKIQLIVSSCRTLSRERVTTLGALSSLLGCMSHAAQTGLWVAPLHYRSLQCCQVDTIHRLGWRRKARVGLSPAVLEDLKWWLTPALPSYNRQDICPPSFRSFNPNGCIIEGLWGNLQWSCNKRALEPTGGDPAHQLPKTESCSPSSSVLPERLASSTTAYTSGDGQ